MCPICWTTALASFGGLVVVAVLTVAATDIISLVLALAVGVATLIHLAGWHSIPWWLLIGLTTVAVARFGYLLLLHRDQLLVCKVWGRACSMATSRCPKRVPANAREGPARRFGGPTAITQDGTD